MLVLVVVEVVVDLVVVGVCLTVVLDEVVVARVEMVVVGAVFFDGEVGT